MRIHSWFAILVATGLTACAEPDGSEPSSWPGGGKGDYYGNDDRQQILDSQHPKAVEWARATAVVVNKVKLQSVSTDRIAATTSTLRERERLCSGERFAAEPSLGFCSSFLVTPDLVATAGHCFKTTLCDEMAFIFDFYAGGASDNINAIPASNVFTCREVVAQQWGNGLDYALVRLDRPTTGRTPFALQPTPPAVGSRVALLGYPSGILAKIDVAGRVLRHEGTDGSRIRTDVDSFPGHSGGVMIDLATGAAFGVHVEGSSPSYVGPGECMRTASCAEVTLDTGGYCGGAVETSVRAFQGCCDGNSPTPPPPPPDPTPTTDACLPSGAPCDTSAECTNAMCACESVNSTTSSFVVPGVCTANGCADLRVLCDQACSEIDLDDLTFTTAWRFPTCEDD
jgi:hypothetical protein